MIVYNTRKYFGYGVFLHVRRTALIAQLPFAVFAAGLSLALKLTNTVEVSPC